MNRSMHTADPFRKCRDVEDHGSPCHWNRNTEDDVTNGIAAYKEVLRYAQRWCLVDDVNDEYSAGVTIERTGKVEFFQSTSVTQ